MSTLSSTYYDRLISHAGASFANLVQTREVDRGRNQDMKIKHYQTLFEQLHDGTSSSTKKNFSNKKNDKNEKCLDAIS